MTHNPMSEAPAMNYTKDGSKSHKNIITMWIGTFLSISIIVVIFLMICHLGELSNITVNKVNMGLPLAKEKVAFASNL